MWFFAVYFLHSATFVAVAFVVACVAYGISCFGKWLFKE
jgi:hypothetical protein